MSLIATWEGISAISRSSTPVCQSTREPVLLTDSSRTTQDPFMLPAPTEMQRLVKIFFTHTGHVFPYIRETMVLGYIASLQKSENNTLEPVKYCILNMCMAFAIIQGQLDPPSEDNLAFSYEYFQRARVMIPGIIAHMTSIESIQALLLGLQYSQGTQCWDETWSLLGYVVHGALQLGLYRPAITERVPPIDGEMRIRVWWMCVMMDRMCSMTFGRPPLIPNAYITSTHLPFPTECLGTRKTGINLQDPSSATLSTSTSFTHTSTLNLILGEIIEDVYDRNLESSMSASLPALLERVIAIESRLEDWRMTYLPLLASSTYGLDPEDPQPGPLQEERAQVLLSLRYLNVRALLHRAVLYHMLEKKLDSDVCDQYYNEGMNTSVASCLDCAVSSVKLISYSMQRPALLPIWWFSAYYTLNASLTLLAAVVLLVRGSVNLPTYTIPGLVDILKTALDAISSMPQGNRVVRRCQQTIKQILHTCLALMPESRIEDQRNWIKSRVLDRQEEQLRHDFWRSRFQGRPGSPASSDTKFLHFTQWSCRSGVNLVEDLIANNKAHPLLDDYHRSKCVQDLARINVPAYVVADWGDHGMHTRGTLNGFMGISSKEKWLEVHGRKKWRYFFEPESVRRQEAFFQKFLKGQTSEIDSYPRVRLEVRNRAWVGAFRDEQEWPLARTKYTKKYLDAQSRQLVDELPASLAVASYKSRVTDDCVLFHHRFSQETELTGTMRLRLWVSTDHGEDMDLFVQLDKLDCEGKITPFVAFSMIDDGPLGLGWLRVSHRELDNAKTTIDRPFHTHERRLLLRPGEIVPVDIEILPTSTLFHEGEVLQLRIQGNDSFRHKTPDVVQFHEETVNEGTHSIYSGCTYESYLVLPVVV
ncbi:uncharacterized protein CDV56_101946 [Aspergillus thermomutatus]|uniref:Transcription factor domain-containing protein n=1 Tax=Aspergillus thermomutatus TaxID=41047 RepID=A0A397G0S7_ASPTH|nr:uncharacterized protein CDV56_101946 [Aspergillus thermomutatus]RHZ43424.1 hypothetical protein CDV56_101946 [Aspergillus thermomutatus]